MQKGTSILAGADTPNAANLHAELGNPLEDITTTSSVRYVMANGRLRSAAELLSR